MKLNINVIVRRYLLPCLAALALVAATTSCLPKNYNITYEDGEWDMYDYGVDQSLINAELEMDDYER